MANKRTKRTIRAPRTVAQDWNDANVVGNDEGTDNIGLTKTAGGLAYMLPVSMLRASASVKEGAAQVQRLVTMRAQALDEIEALIGEMREEGASWGVIAYSTGVTSDGARRRWGTAE